MRVAVDLVLDIAMWATAIFAVIGFCHFVWRQRGCPATPTGTT